MPAYTFRSKVIPPEAWDQTETWYNRAGEEYRIQDMNKMYAMNVCSYLIDKYGIRVTATPVFQAILQRAGERA